MKREEEPHRYCHACGSRYLDTTSWPRACHRCAAVSWGNPRPCVVVLAPLLLHRDKPNDSFFNRSLLTIRRKIEPHVGGLALPGGYIDRGESWQQAAARELREETGIVEKPENFTMYSVESLPDAAGGIILLFCTAPPRWIDAFDMTYESEETHDLSAMAYGPQDLCFSAHTKVAKRWFYDPNWSRPMTSE